MNRCRRALKSILIAAVFLASFPADAAKTPFRFRVETLSGGAISHEDFKGKIVVVDVWATWCGPCQMIIPHLVRLQEKYRERGVVVVGLSADTEGVQVSRPTLEKIRAFTRRFAINYPIGLMNPQAYAEVARVMGFDDASGMSIPTTLILGRDGSVLKTYGGYFPGQETEIEELVARLLRVKDASAEGR